MVMLHCLGQHNHNAPVLLWHQMCQDPESVLDNDGEIVPRLMASETTTSCSDKYHNDIMHLFTLLGDDIDLEQCHY